MYLFLYIGIISAYFKFLGWFPISTDLFMILDKGVDKTDLGAVYMNQASPANRADLGHENLYFSTT